MKIRVERHTPVIQRDGDMRPMGENRGAGIHLSHVIRDIEVRIYKKKYDTGVFTPEDLATMADAGFAWEQREILRLKAEGRSFVLPGEIMKDGILMTPDGLLDVEETIPEFKRTYRSVRGLENWAVNFWGWETQVMGYCHAYGLKKALFIVDFVCGDYSRPFKPIPLKIWLEFTAQELENRWATVRRHAANMRANGWTGKRD